MSSGELDAWQRAEFARLCSSIRRLRHGFYHDGNYVRERKPLTQTEKEFNAADIETYLKEAEDIRTLFADEVERQDKALNAHGALWGTPTRGSAGLFYNTGPLSLEMQTDLFMVDYVRGFMRGLEGAYTGQTSQKDRIDGICRYIKSLDEAKKKAVGKVEQGLMRNCCAKKASESGGNGDQEMDPDWGKAYQWNSQGWGMGDFEIGFGGGKISQVWIKAHQDVERNDSTVVDYKLEKQKELNSMSRRSASQTILPQSHNSSNNNNSLQPELYPRSSVFVCSTEKVRQESNESTKEKSGRQTEKKILAKPISTPQKYDNALVLNQIYSTTAVADNATSQENTSTQTNARAERKIDHRLP